MIIKKVKLPKDDDDNNKARPKKKMAKPIDPQDDGPRAERRRGDRRRGYRRIDDRSLISRAHEEANSVREMSSREGFEYGLEKANEQIDQLNVILTELLEARDKSMNAASSEIASLAIKVAEKIIKQEVTTNPDIVLTITAEAIKEMGKGHQSIIIKVNPADIELVRENIPSLYPYGNSKTNIVVIQDNEVEWGSCIIETNTGLIDARFSTQLGILQKALDTGG